MNSPRLAIARRELGNLRKGKTIALALTIQLFVVVLSSFLIVGFISLYNPGAASYQIGMAVTDDEEAIEDLFRAVGTEDRLSGQPYVSTPAAMTAFHERGVDAVLEAFTGEDGRIRVVAVAPGTGAETTMVATYLCDALHELERTEHAERRAFLETDPLSLPPAAESSPYFDFTYTVFAPLLLFLPVSISRSLVVDLLTEEVAHGTLGLLRATPVSSTAVVDGKLLAAGGLAPAQAVAWVLFLHLNGMTIENVPWLFGMVVGLSAVVVTLGVVVAIMLPDRRVVQLLYLIGVLLVLAGTSLLPLNPANTTAWLVLRTVDVGMRAAVAGLVSVDVVVLVGLRVVVNRVDPDELG